MIESSDISRKIINTNCTVSWIAEGIVFIQWKSGIDIEISDIDELSKAFHELSEGKLVKVLQDFGQYTSISSEARSYAAKKSPDLVARAYIIKGLGQRMVLKFYIRLRNQNCPTKVFMSFDEALEWVKNI